MNILDFYKQVLLSLNHQVDKEGLISFAPPGQSPVPATIDKRRMVLPTKEWQRKGFTDELQPFHPISESIARKGASPVLAHMQRTAKALFAYYLVEITTRLLEVAADPALHKDVPPGFSGFLKKVSNADKKSVQDFGSLLDKALSKNKLLTLYLKHGGKLEDKKFNRLCVVQFPLAGEIEASDGDTVLGIKIRKKDRKTFVELLNHVLPNGSNAQFYSAGSNSRVAPFFEAFMKAYTNVADQFNAIIGKYMKPLDLTLSEIPLEYKEGLEDLNQYYEKIPRLRGNEGNVEDEDEVQKPEPKQSVKSLYDKVNEPSPRPIHEPVVEQPPQHHVSVDHRPTPQPNAGRMSMDDFRRETAPQHPQYQPPPPSYPQHHMSMQYPQQQFGYPQQGPVALPWNQPAPQMQGQPQAHPFTNVLGPTMNNSPMTQRFGQHTGSAWSQPMMGVPGGSRL